MKRRPPEYLRNDDNGDVHIRPRLGLNGRTMSTKPRLRALEELQANLAGATVMHESHGDGGQLGAYMALNSVVDYLTALGIPPATLTPLTGIMAAFQHLRDGEQLDLFKCTPKVGAPGKSVIESQYEQVLACICECCVRHFRAKGQRRYLEEACKAAARLANKSRLAADVSWVRMRELRERTKQLRPGSLGRVHFDILCDTGQIEVNPWLCAVFLANSDWVTKPPAKFPDNPTYSPD